MPEFIQSRYIELWGQKLHYTKHSKTELACTEAQTCLQCVHCLGAIIKMQCYFHKFKHEIRCFFKRLILLKVAWQMKHSFGFSPVCFLLCTVSRPLCRNALPQSAQRNFFPAHFWLRIWLLKDFAFSKHRLQFGHWCLWQCLSVCFSNACFVENNCRHFSHWCVFPSPPCFRALWVLRVSLRLNATWQTEQMKFLSLLWTNMWPSKLCNVWNALSHLLHWKGLSPVCFITCKFNLAFSINPAPQTLHWCGFSPECIFAWRVSVPFCLNAFPHCSHTCGVSPVWIRLWVFKLHFRRVAAQTGHASNDSTPDIFGCPFQSGSQERQSELQDWSHTHADSTKSSRICGSPKLWGWLSDVFFSWKEMKLWFIFEITNFCCNLHKRVNRRCSSHEHCWRALVSAKRNLSCCQFQIQNCPERTVAAELQCSCRERNDSSTSQTFRQTKTHA